MAMSIPVRTPAPALVFGALILVQVLFGVNYVVSKVLVDNFPPLVWASLRLFVAAGMMLTLARISGRPHPKATRAFFVPLIKYSLLGIILNQGAFLLGLSYTTATNSAVLNTLIPIFTLAIVTLRGQESFTVPKGIGFVAALLGVLVIRRVDQFSLSDKTLAGDLLTMFNCFCYALFLSYAKPFLEAHDRLWTTAWLFAYGAIAMPFVALPSYLTFHWPVMTPTLELCMLFSVLGGTIGTYFLNLWALTYTRSSSVALFIYLQPMVASAVAWLWFGERATMRVIVSSGLILIGVLSGLYGSRFSSEGTRRVA
jgi:drug/metabolite transporter (DMT)-like permease